MEYQQLRPTVTPTNRISATRWPSAGEPIRLEVSLEDHEVTTCLAALRTARDAARYPHETRALDKLIELLGG